MDYKNEFKKGNTALFLHTSPHKQYYVYIANCLEKWMSDHLEKLEKKQFLIQNGKISYFMNMKNMVGTEFKNGSFLEQNGIEISTQGKFEML